jgi:hypothetical protein
MQIKQLRQLFIELVSYFQREMHGVQWRCMQK